MVRQPIEERPSQAFRSEHVSPFIEREIRRHDGRSPLVTLREDFEQKLGAGFRQRHKAKFVNDEQFRFANCFVSGALTPRYQVVD